MTDLHTHILPYIDDGANNIAESINLLKHLSNIGVADLVLTPHYIVDSKYNYNNKDKKLILNKLQEEVKKNNLTINLYLGNEIYITDNIIDLIEKNEITSINNSKYLLIEFPLYQEKKDYLDIIDELNRNGYKVILAHPERYQFVIDNYKNLKKYIDKGVLLQGNIPSLYNKYGKKSKKVLKKLIKKGWISFLASDIHHSFTPYEEMKLVRKLEWYTSRLEIKKMLKINFYKVINNLDI